MRHLLSLSAAALLLSAASAFAADPVGDYVVQGTNPGSASSYTGTVSVQKTGDTYRVVWVVGNRRWIGTGIGNKEFIAVSYKSGRDTGIALYGSNGDNWTGVWTYAGSHEIGTEVWHRD